MSLLRGIKHYHLLCLGLFSPRSIVTQVMKSPLTLSIAWPEPLKPSHKALLERKFTLAGTTIDMSHAIDWNPDKADKAWLRAFYSFRWLDDLIHASDEQKTASMIREFIGTFITEHQHIPDIAWEEDVAGERLAKWLNYRHFMMKGANKRFVSCFGRSLIRHAKRLDKALHTTPSTCGLSVYHGMLALTSSTPDIRFMREDIIDELPNRLKADILPDACHVSCNPKEHMNALQTILNIGHLLAEYDEARPEVEAAIHSMAQALDFFRHGDGRLSLFGGGLLVEKDQIDAVLQASHYDKPLTKASHELPHGGFAHIRNGTVTLIAKTTDRHPHDIHGTPCYRDALSFELSDESERFIVNCGGFLGNSPLWQDVMRRAAAHSTLSCEDTPSPDTLPHEHNAPPSFDTMQASMEDSGAWHCQAGSTQIYHEQGLAHQRTLELAHDGKTLSGSDTIFNHRAPKMEAPAACLRFHLHPDIRCKRDGEHHIKLTAVSGTSWIFSCEAHEAVIEESVYLGYYGAPQKTLQIVIRPKIKADRMTVDWVVKKEDSEAE